MKSYFLIAFIFISTSALLFYSANHITSEEVEQFTAFLKSLEGEKPPLKVSALQERFGVERTIYSIDSAPMFFDAKSSSLKLGYNNNKEEISETLHDFEGWVLEENSVARQILAQEAFYSSLKNFLSAKNVVSKAFLSQSEEKFNRTDLKQKGSLSPDHVHFKAGIMEYENKKCLLNNEIDLMHPMGRMLADNILIVMEDKALKKESIKDIFVNRNISIFPKQGGCFQGDYLHLNTAKKRGEFVGFPSIRYQGENGKLFSKEAELDYDDQEGKWDLREIIFRHNVRWVNLNQKQFALADHVRYNPLTKTTILSSISKNKVLIVDLEREFELSANEVIAEKDTFGIDQFSGKGAVRMRFNAEEWEKVKRAICDEIPSFAKS